MSMRLMNGLVLAVITGIVGLHELTASTPSDACHFWVASAPAGSDSNPGTAAEPWATLDHASATVPDNNCTVWFGDGVYAGTNDLHERFRTLTTFKAVNPYRAILEHDGLVVEISGGRNIVIEGFEIRHSRPDAGSLVVYVSRKDDLWAEHIIFRDNIFHDSYNNDLMKIHNGARFVTVENNVFYNQAAPEEHMDVNSVTDVVIQDNIFFNDFVGSGRSNVTEAHSFITIKDSNENSDGLEGSERVTVRRNIFLNWEGRRDTFIQVGNDGKAYHEAKDVQIENNLMIGNSGQEVYALLGARGVKNLSFTNNTIVGDLPSSAYGFWISVKDQNPRNENIQFYNNIWSDPTGTMGADLSGGRNKFSNGEPAQVSNLVLDNNLYWNGGEAVPPGELVSPLVHDARRTVGDPKLNTDQSEVVLPRWNGDAFLSGSRSIRDEFVRLVGTYGAIPANSPAVDRADPAFAPDDDILGHTRSVTPDLGAYEYRPMLPRTFLPLLVGQPSGVASPTVTSTTSPTTLPTPTAPPESVRITVPATDDASVVAGMPDTSYGSETVLTADYSPATSFLLKFVVSGTDKHAIASARLELYSVGASNHGGDVRRIIENDWSEDSVTWNTAPAAETAMLASLGPVDRQTWYDIDVTSMITGDGTYSLLVSSPSTNGADYASKEQSAMAAPRLVITQSAAGVTTTPTLAETTTPTGTATATPEPTATITGESGFVPMPHKDSARCRTRYPPIRMR